MISATSIPPRRASCSSTTAHASWPLTPRTSRPKPNAISSTSASRSTPAAHVTNVGPGWVEANDNRIEAAVVLWAAGVQASPLGKMLGAPTDKRGCVIVDSNLNPPGLPEVFVIGDLAHFEQDGQQVPGVAQPAMQMGDHIGKMIAADLARQPRPAFRYFDKGDMATIGRMAAVAKVEWPFHGHLSGFPAWITWIVVHIFFLIGFRNRVAVFSQWIWTYFTFTRAPASSPATSVSPAGKTTSTPAPQSNEDTRATEQVR